MQILTSEKDSFANFTIKERFPNIIKMVIKDNHLDNKKIEELNKLLESIPSGVLKPIQSNSLYTNKINEILLQNDYTWDSSPFLFVENYLYHKLCEILEFDKNRNDFFIKKKITDTKNKLSKMEELYGLVNDNLKEDFNNSLSNILKMNLMGNKADLSQNADYFNENIAEDKILINHAQESESIFRNAKRIDIILDNAGEELFSDLLLTYWILEKTKVKTVNLHLKKIPYFVSDASIADVDILLDLISQSEKLSGFASIIKNYIKKDKVKLHTHEFWNSHELFKNMPKELFTFLQESDLLIFKGDLNYRKLVGDNNYNYFIETSSIVNYLPTNCLIIRVLKSEVVVGLTPSIIPKNNKDWLYNGKYGIIELC